MSSLAASTGSCCRRRMKSRRHCGTTPASSPRTSKPTAEEVLLGIVLALLVGFGLAVAIHLSPLLRRAVYPLAVGSQAVPVAVIAVLLIFWWGFGILPKLVVITLICFFPVLVTTVDGLAAVDPDELQAAAHARRLALAGVSPRGAARGPPGRDQRRADRPHGRSDRRRHRRVPDRDHRSLRRPRPRDQRRSHRPADPAGVRGGAGAVRVRDRLLLRARARRAPAGAVGLPDRRERFGEAPRGLAPRCFAC